MKNNKIQKEYSVVIAGAAGEGSRLAGMTIAKLFNAYGWRVSIFEDYQSLIMGGHNFSRIRATQNSNGAPVQKIDFLIALNQYSFDKHSKDLDNDGIAIYNSDTNVKCDFGFGISGKEVIAKFQAKPIMKNGAFLGAFAKVIGLPWDFAEKIFREEFKKETEKNLEIAKYGYEQADTLEIVPRLKNPPMNLITGNEAVSLGALDAGLKFYCAYPMTPATSVLHFMANHKEKYGIKVFQAENEIAVIMAALGASYAGQRSMVATSGGGFALMAEGVSMAAIAETPVVIINSQRPGPATGIPTYSGQGDLNFILNAGHGDFVRFVFAPGDAQECYQFSAHALNLAWKYQTPSFVLIDKDLSEGTYEFNPKLIGSIKPQKELLWSGKGEYARYTITKDGISPMAYPGTPNIVVKATSYEHLEDGITAEEEEDMIQKMQDKRLRKFASMQKEVDKMKDAVKVFGNKSGKTAIIAWGSSKGVALEMAEKFKAKFVQPIVMQPFPIKQMQNALKGVKKIICIESNATGQLAQLLAQHAIKVDAQIHKYTGRPFFVDELEKELSKKIK